MRRVVCSGFLCCFTAALALAQTARAEPAFDTFTNICVANRAETAAVTKAMTTGWMPLPQNMLNSMSKKMLLEDASGWMRFSNDTVQVLLQARGQFPVAPDVTFRICAMLSLAQTPDKSPEKMADAAAAFAAIPPQGHSRVTFWAWQTENGQHRPVTFSRHDPEAKAELARGTIQLLFSEDDAKKSMVGLAIPEAGP